MPTIYEKIDKKLKKIEKKVEEKGYKKGIDDMLHTKIVERYRGKSLFEKLHVCIKILSA